jgi:hypothetical protein
MIAVTLPEEILKKLTYVSEKTEKSRSFLIRESLIRVLDDLEYEFEKREVNLHINSSFYELLVTECKEPMELTTGARKVAFTMFSDEGKLYVLNSKGNTLPLDEKPANEFFELFKKTGSTSPMSYRDSTFNASYFLAATQELMRRGTI